MIIEHPRGSQRPHKAGKTLMQAHYGFIKNTRGVDGDEVDCYLGPNELATHVHIVKQLKKDTGEFDELKLMMGFNSEEEAKSMYLNHYSNDARFFGGIITYPMEILKLAIQDNKYNAKAIKSFLYKHDHELKLPINCAECNTPLVKLDKYDYYCSMCDNNQTHKCR